MDILLVDLIAIDTVYRNLKAEFELRCVAVIMHALDEAYGETVELENYRIELIGAQDQNTLVIKLNINRHRGFSHEDVETVIVTAISTEFDLLYDKTQQSESVLGYYYHPTMLTYNYDLRFQVL